MLRTGDGGGLTVEGTPPPIATAEGGPSSATADCTRPRAVADGAALPAVADGTAPPAVADAISPSAAAHGTAPPAVADGTTLPALCSGPPLRIAFDPVVLLSALEASVGPDVLLEIASTTEPVVVRSADQGSFTTLVMPVRPRTP